MSNVSMQIAGMNSDLHQQLLEELRKEGFMALPEPTDLSIHVQCPTIQSDVPGEIVHRLLEDHERETDYSMAV